MNFFEAMKALEEGNIVISPTNGKCKKINEHIHWWADHDDIWKPVTGLDIFDMTKEWEIYEEPEEKKGIWERCGCCDSSLITITTYSRFENKDQERMWEHALEKFMELKGHPLAVKAEENVKQYILVFYGNIEIHSFYYLESKLGHISPVFNSIEDVNKAMNDIGKENLLKMAKVFQGIYE